MKAVLPQSKVALYLSWVIAGILALLPFHAVFTTWLGSNFDHLDLFRIWKEVVLAIITPITLWLAWQRPKLKDWLLNSWTARLFYIYILLHIVLGAWALSTREVNSTALIYAFIVNLRFIAFFIICYIVAATTSFLKDNWQRLLLGPAAVVVLFGLIQKLLLPYDFLRHFGYGAKSIPAYQTVDSDLDYRRVQSTLRGANPLGAYLILIVSGLVVTLRKNRTFQIISLIITAAVLFFSYSRSAWIGTIAALAVLVWLSRYFIKYMRWVILAAAVTLLLIVSAFFFLRSNESLQDTLLHTSNNSTSAQDSNEVRAESIKSGIRDVIHEPLGRGPGTAGPASFRNDQHSRVAENYYLQIGQEVGVIGIVLFVAINILVALQLWKVKKRPLAQILLASLVGITLANMVSHAWTDDTLSLLWWGFAGIELAPAILSSKRKQDGKVKQA